MVILSNGTRRMLDPLVRHNGLGEYFIDILSSEQVQAFKPDASIYALAHGLVGTLPFIALFQWGFLYTSGMSLAQRFEWLVPREQEA